ncbi:MAG: dockerin type I repeat-containing protein [candidate division Zixibacteria bacterium]|nr:dockerin type I repeat-containing protein [candidate division Zixibacteria bacterium]
MSHPVRLILVLVFLFGASSPLSAASSSYQLIEQAFNAGKFSDEERLVLLVQSIKDQEALPQQFQSSVVEVSKSATPILLEVHAKWESFSPENKTLLRGYYLRPSATHTYNTPSGKLKIHYNISGGDAVPTADGNSNGIPDYIEWLADYADSSYRTQVTYLGHLEPPSDFSGGGDSRYDIYTEEMPYYGYTQPEGYGDRPWGDIYSYASVHRNFYGFPPNDDPEGNQKGAMKVTVAHEYYHGIQLGYEVNMGSDIWFMEMSSTWMEEWAFPLVNDNYGYLSYWFNHPEYSMHYSTGGHMYGGFVWPKYLEENFGAVIMQQLWAETIGSTPYQDFATILANYATTLGDQFTEFSLWNFITATYDDGLHYEDAADYPSMSIMRSHSSYPVTNQTPTASKRPDAMAANYINFNLPSGPGTFTVEFDGDNSTPWRVKLLTMVYSGGYQFGEHEMTLDGNGDGSFAMIDLQNWSRLIMIVCNVSQTLNDRSYTYGASFQPYSGYDVRVNATDDDSVYSASYTVSRFQVENAGIYPDTFAITADDGLGWSVNPSPHRLFLNAGQIDTVNVNVNCPPLTNEGVINRIVVTATAVSTMGVDDSDSCLVTVFVQRGDADNNGLINIADLTYIINYIFGGGSVPVPIVEAGDADCDTMVNISDAVALITYIFAGGPYPPCNPF